MKHMREGTIVRLLDYEPPMVAQVMEMLSVQFTVQYMDGTNTVSFRFFRDEGDTWEFVT